MSTITREFTKEQLIEHLRTRIEHRSGLIANMHIDRGYRDYLKLELRSSEIALASLEAEPVAWRYRTTDIKGNPLPDWGFSEEESLLGLYQPLYTAPPAPVSVPEKLPCDLENEWSLVDAANKNKSIPDEKVKGDDFELNGPLSCYQAGKIDGWNEYRSTMLQCADQLQSAQQNIPENIPSTQFKPVADLYGISIPGGRATTYSTDAAEASDCRVMGWAVQEYVKLERYQDTVSGNSPVIPDGWVMVPFEPTEDMIVNGFESEPDESFSDEKEWEAYEAMSGCQQAAHRAKLCWAAMIGAAQKLRKQ